MTECLHSALRQGLHALRKRVAEVLPLGDIADLRNTLKPLPDLIQQLEKFPGASLSKEAKDRLSKMITKGKGLLEDESISLPAGLKPKRPELIMDDGMDYMSE